MADNKRDGKIKIRGGFTYYYSVMIGTKQGKELYFRINAKQKVCIFCKIRRGPKVDARDTFIK